MEKRNALLCIWIPESLFLTWSAFHKYCCKYIGTTDSLLVWLSNMVFEGLKWGEIGMRLGLAAFSGGCVIAVCAWYSRATRWLYQIRQWPSRSLSIHSILIIWCLVSQPLQLDVIPIPRLVEQSMRNIQKWGKIQSTVKNNIWYQTLCDKTPLHCLLNTNHPISASR